MALYVLFVNHALQMRADTNIIVCVVKAALTLVSKVCPVITQRRKTARNTFKALGRESQVDSSHATSSQDVLSRCFATSLSPVILSFRSALN